MEEKLLEKLMEITSSEVDEGVKKTLTTAAATGLIGGAAMLKGFTNSKQTFPVSPDVSYQQVVKELVVDIDRLADIESSNDPKAENKRTGARGLLQIMRPTWEEMTKKMGVSWSWDEAFDREKNEEVGNYYINVEIPRLLQYYGLEDTIENRLAAYNWGIGNLKKFGLDKAPKETRDYISKYTGESFLREAVGFTTEIVKLPLSNTDKYAIVDREDYNKVKDYTWRLLKDKRTNVWYVGTSKREGPIVRTIRLHRLIMDAGPGEDVHHKDLNPLNNTKENLELLSKEEHRIRHTKAYLSKHHYK